MLMINIQLFIKSKHYCLALRKILLVCITSFV